MRELLAFFFASCSVLDKNTISLLILSPVASVSDRGDSVEWNKRLRIELKRFGAIIAILMLLLLDLFVAGIGQPKTNVCVGSFLRCYRCWGDCPPFVATEQRYRAIVNEGEEKLKGESCLLLLTSGIWDSG